MLLNKSNLLIFCLIMLFSNFFLRAISELISKSDLSFNTTNSPIRDFHYLGSYWNKPLKHV